MTNFKRLQELQTLYVSDNTSIHEINPFSLYGVVGMVKQEHVWDVQSRQMFSWFTQDPENVYSTHQGPSWRRKTCGYRKVSLIGLLMKTNSIWDTSFPHKLTQTNSTPTQKLNSLVRIQQCQAASSPIDRTSPQKQGSFKKKLRISLIYSCATPRRSFDI